MNTQTCQKRPWLLAVLVTIHVAVALLTGCASRHTVQTTQTASVGQQLQDLDKAYQQGTINQKEYERLRKAIVKNND